MYKILITLSFLIFGLGAHAASYTYYMVPMYEKNKPKPSSLYLKLNTTTIGTSYSEFKKASASNDKDDALFIRTMDALINNDPKLLEPYFYKRHGLSTQNEIAKYVSSTNKLYKGFNNLTVISKVELGNKKIYVWSVDINGRKIATGQFFEKVSGQYKYKDFDSISDVETLVKQVVVKSFLLPSQFKTSKSLSKKFQVQLEDEQGRDIDAFFLFDGHFDYVVKGNQQYVFTQNTNKADPEIKAIFQFYSDLKGALSQNKYNYVLDAMEPSSKNRFRNLPPNSPVASSQILEDKLLPGTLVFIVNAEPYYIVLGTNYTDDLNSAIVQESQSLRLKKVKQIPFFHSYVKNQKAPKLVSVLYTGYLDRVLSADKFIGRKIIAPLMK